MASFADSRGFRVFIAYAAAVLVTYGLALIAATQWMLGGSLQVGEEVTATRRLLTTGQELVSMLPSYGVIVAVAMALALSAAAAISHYLPRLRGVALVAAGFIGLMGVHFVAQQLIGDTPVAVAETTGGLLAQGLAGGIGGYLYYLMRRS